MISLATIASGILVSKAFLYFGMELPALRYSIATLLSYGAFFVFVYIWLRAHSFLREESSNDSHLDALDLIDIPAGPSAPAPPEWGGGGGNFAGGGATSTWGPKEKSSFFKSESESSLVDDLSDVDEGAIFLLLIALILAISGSAAFIIYQAPEVLFEAAFEAVLVAGLLKNTKGVQAEGWAYSVFKKTWWLFLLVLIATWVFGSVIKSQCPEATSFAQYRKLCGTSK